MEQTEFQQMMAELKEKNERKRFEQLSQKYATAPDFSNMSLRDEIGVRYDLELLERMKQKFGSEENLPIPQQHSDRLQQVVDNYNPQPRYGDATAKELDNYLKGYTIPEWPSYFGSLAPYIDFGRNYADMYIKDLDPSDKFFHCKANYEATSRGKQGEDAAIKLRRLRETLDMLTGDSASDSLADTRANIRGQFGFKMGKSLQETCPTYYKEYEKW